jgi:hypothetical protein
MTSKTILVLTTAMIALTIVFASAASVVSASSAVAGTQSAISPPSWFGHVARTAPVVSASTPVTGGAAVTTQDHTGIDLFVRATNGSILWKHSSDGSNWSAPPENLGGIATADPAVASPVPGVMAVFVRGADSAHSLWVSGTTDGGATWDNWVPLNGSLASGTGPAAIASNLYDWAAFVQGTNGHLYWTYSTNQGGTWTNWATPQPPSNPGQLTASPAADNPSIQINNVFARGTNNGVWWNVYNSGTWGGWTSLGGQVLPNTGPASTNWGQGSDHVFVEGTDSHMWYKTNTLGTWSSWKVVGARMSTSPGAVQRTATSIDVFAGNANSIYQTEWNGATWSSWSSVPI